MKLAQDWEVESDCIHVDPSDDPFKGRMRFHQSWYRACVLRLPPGVNQASKAKKPYGSVLRTSDGEQGYNFLTEGIRQVARDRLAEAGGAIDPNRLHCNLLSSQPMCFNLFGPLQLDTSLATTLVSALPGLPDGIEVTSVKLEYAPDQSKHLMDRSAFDAFIEYRRGDRRGFIGVETKLTEPFSQKSYSFSKDSYSRWLQSTGWWWSLGSEEAFANPQFNQIWRNHLLAFAMLRQEPCTYDEGFCAVIHHDLDVACPRALDAYAQHLNPGGASTLLQWRLNDVVARWKRSDLEQGHQDWLDNFHMRYLGMDASEPAWRLRKVHGRKLNSAQLV